MGIVIQQIPQLQEYNPIWNLQLVHTTIPTRKHGIPARSFLQFSAHNFRRYQHQYPEMFHYNSGGHRPKCSASTVTLQPRAQHPCSFPSAVSIQGSAASGSIELYKTSETCHVPPELQLNPPCGRVANVQGFPSIPGHSCPTPCLACTINYGVGQPYCMSR